MIHSSSVFYIVVITSNNFLEEPTYPSEICIRQNGLFADPDPSICHVYHTCIKGHATRTECSGVLIFDESTGLCNWPAAVKRSGCAKKAAGK